MCVKQEPVYIFACRGGDSKKTPVETQEESANPESEGGRVALALCCPLHANAPICRSRSLEKRILGSLPALAIHACERSAERLCENSSGK